ncbi:hypothetical protein Tco_0672742, partial [Tanacetum coccineum]
HRRLSRLNFDYIKLLSKKDVVIGLPKLKYVKDQLCSSYEGCETPEVLKEFLTMIQRNLQALVISVRTDRGTEFVMKTSCFLQQKEGIEIKEMSETSVANDTSGLVPQRQKVLDYDNSDPDPQLQKVSPSADTNVPSQQELDLLFGPLYDEFFNAGTSCVNKCRFPLNTLLHESITDRN